MAVEGEKEEEKIFWKELGRWPNWVVAKKEAAELTSFPRDSMAASLEVTLNISEL